MNLYYSYIQLPKLGVLVYVYHFMTSGNGIQVCILLFKFNSYINISSIIYYIQMINDCSGSKNPLKNAMDDRNLIQKNNLLIRQSVSIHSWFS